MKTGPITYLIALVALVVDFVAPVSEPSLDNTSRLSPQIKDTLLVGEINKSLAIRAPDDDPAAIYRKADCKGQKLLGACLNARTQAGVYIQPVDSLWTVPITQSLTTWGYRMETDNGNAQWRASHEDECELATNHNLRRMCTALGIDTRSTYQGGPNRCYFVTHANSAAVIRDAQGRLPPVSQQWYNVAGNNYRITNAKFTIGVNIPSGLVIMTDRESPASSAEVLWRLNAPPAANTLPAIRSSSGIMWGLWKQVSGQYVQRISRFLITPIVNDDTVSIINNILARRSLREDQLPGWPGLEFIAASAEYKPLLGSPNGQAVGFFLAQHKRQLGGKFISKINVFRSENNDALAICMLFTVQDHPAAARRGTDGVYDGTELVSEPVVVERNQKGSNVVRDHVLRPKL
ncbi:hypothetical protein TW65_09267 [Stemphylium lycopersici]|nr:hypothetical protein TW65_09267 [Stemphylium lycopersici]